MRWIACASASAMANRACACPFARSTAASISPCARLTCDCWTPSASRIAARFDASASVTVARRLDGLQLDTRDVDAPPDRRLLYNLAHALVDLIAAGERAVELHLADDVAQRRARERFEREREILDGVGGLLRIGDAIVEDRIDVDGHVVFRDHGLARKVEHLLAEIDARGGSGDEASGAARVAHGVAHVDRARTLHERQQDVEARARDAVEPA